MLYLKQLWRIEKVNRKEFLLKLKELFGNDLRVGLVNAYKLLLTDINGTEINYDELYRLLINEYKFKNAPMPAWFAERLILTKKCKCAQKSTLDRDLDSGKLKTISYNSETTETVYELPNGTRQTAYNRIVEDQAGE